MHVWTLRLVRSKGRELPKTARDRGCEFVSTGKSTYWPTDAAKKPEWIDFC